MIEYNEFPIIQRGESDIKIQIGEKSIKEKTNKFGSLKHNVFKAD